jgi:molybdopterin/thiamine biosynthesis adenylyltransferase
MACWSVKNDFDLSEQSLMSQDPPATSAVFDYDLAFSRNLGLTQPEEQRSLRNATVAIAGLGGVGGVHALTLARLGIGRFHIADFDHFELHNFNRQVGAMMSTLGRDKSETMKSMILDINPEAQVTIFPEGVTAQNVYRFFEGVTVAVDGLDFFALGARDIFYEQAASSGVPVVAVGPIGCSAALLVFVPGGMTWHEYFAMDMAADDYEKYVLFALGTAPRTTHISYMDRSYVDLVEQKVPSLAAAVSLCSGVLGAEVLKLILKRGKVYPAPHFSQYDAYQCRYIRGRLRWGNRGPVQRLKFALFRRLYRRELSDQK